MAGMETPEGFGPYLQQVRDANGWSANEVAERATRAGSPMTGKTLRDYEREKTRCPVKRIPALAVALHVAPSILWEQANMEPPSDPAVSIGDGIEIEELGVGERSGRNVIKIRIRDREIQSTYTDAEDRTRLIAEVFRMNEESKGDGE